MKPIGFTTLETAITTPLPLRNYRWDTPTITKPGLKHLDAWRKRFSRYLGSDTGLCRLTTRRRRTYLRHLLWYLQYRYPGDIDLSGLSISVIISFFAWLKAERKASKYWLHEHRIAFEQFFEWLSQQAPGKVDHSLLGPECAGAFAAILPPKPRIRLKKPKDHLPDFWKQPVEFHLSRLPRGIRTGFTLNPKYDRLATLLKVLPEFLQQAHAEGQLAATTLQTYRRGVLSFLHYLQDIRGLNLGLENIDRKLALDCLVWYREKKKNNVSTVANLGLAIKAFFNWLHRERKIRVNLLRDLPIPKVPKRFPRPLEMEVISQLLQTPNIHSFVGARDRAIFELMYGSGLRISEAIGLTFGNLELEGSGDGPFIGVIGKGDHQRFIPLTQASVDALRWFLRFRGIGKPGDKVFVKSNGDKLVAASFQARLQRYRQPIKTKRPLTSHRLRHSFATHLYASGAPIEVVSRLLGHAQISTTEIYAEVTRKFIFEAYRKASFREKLPPAPSPDVTV